MKTQKRRIMTSTSTSDCGSVKKNMALIGKSEKWLHKNHGFLKTMASWFAISLKNVHVHQKGKKNQGNFTSMVSQDSPSFGIPVINVLFPLVG